MNYGVAFNHCCFWARLGGGRRESFIGINRVRPYSMLGRWARQASALGCPNYRHAYLGGGNN